MNGKIRIGIMGYGNLGRGVESAVNLNSDMELAGIFTRRKPETISPQSTKTQVLHIWSAKEFKDKIDVMILCGGSATDLPEQGPFFAGMFNTIDSYDTHAKIPEYFNKVNEAAEGGGKTAIISVGWDPGLFSINRAMFEAILPEGKGYTFWGKGISQGHSDALRRVEGVKNAVQYTIPVEQAIDKVRKGHSPDFTTREKHIRHCYVVVEEGADKEKIREKIVTMPDYFADYDTKVDFVTEDELKKNHSGMPHGGFVICSGRTGDNNQIAEFSLKLESNPEFTGSVLTAYARAAYRMNQEGNSGGKTVFDIPLSYIYPKSSAEMRKELL